MDDKTKGIGVERTSGRSDEYISGREALDTDGRIGERGTSRIPSRTNPATTSTGSDTTSDTTRNLRARPRRMRRPKSAPARSAPRSSRPAARCPKP